MGEGCAFRCWNSPKLRGLAVAIPNYQAVMLPLLRIVAEHNECTVAEARVAIEKHFRLSGDDSPEMEWSINDQEFQKMVKMIKLNATRGLQPGAVANVLDSDPVSSGSTSPKE